jgi:alkylation response protein AidB-like acyl-CoA dehydrogenase
MAELFDALSRWMDEVLVISDKSVSRLMDSRAAPERLKTWRQNGIFERAATDEMTEGGVLGLSIAPADGDLRYKACVAQRSADAVRAGKRLLGHPNRRARLLRQSTGRRIRCIGTEE